MKRLCIFISISQILLPVCLSWPYSLENHAVQLLKRTPCQSDCIKHNEQVEQDMEPVAKKIWKSVNSSVSRSSENPADAPNLMQKRMAQYFLGLSKDAFKNRAKRSKSVPTERLKFPTEGRPPIELRAVTGLVGDSDLETGESSSLLFRKKNEEVKINCYIDADYTVVCSHGQYVYKIKLPGELFTPETVERLVSSICVNIEPQLPEYGLFGDRNKVAELSPINKGVEGSDAEKQSRQDSFRLEELPDLLSKTKNSESKIKKPCFSKQTKEDVSSFEILAPLPVKGNMCNINKKITESGILSSKKQGKQDLEGFEILAPVEVIKNLTKLPNVSLNPIFKGTGRKIEGPDGYTSAKQEKLDSNLLGLVDSSKLKTLSDPIKNSKQDTLKQENSTMPLQFNIEIPDILNASHLKSNEDAYLENWPTKRWARDSRNLSSDQENVASIREPVISALRISPIQKRKTLQYCIFKRKTTTRRPSINEGKHGVCCIPSASPCTNPKPKCPCSIKPKPCVPITTCPPEPDLPFCGPPSRCPEYQLVTVATTSCPSKLLVLAKSKTSGKRVKSHFRRRRRNKIKKTRFAIGSNLLGEKRNNQDIRKKSASMGIQSMQKNREGNQLQPEKLRYRRKAFIKELYTRNKNPTPDAESTDFPQGRFEPGALHTSQIQANKNVFLDKSTKPKNFKRRTPPEKRCSDNSKQPYYNKNVQHMIIGAPRRKSVHTGKNSCSCGSDCGCSCSIHSQGKR